MRHGLIEYCSSHIIVCTDGIVCVPARDTVGRIEEVRKGSEVWIEADLRSEERSKRTLHWFVDGRQQTVYLYNVPANIQFGVCMAFYDTLYLHPFAF